MSEIIHILHTNDLHSHFERWPKIRRYLEKKQTDWLDNNEDYLTVDLGDFMDRVHPLTDATDGQANVALMNQGHYDFATIGNNEGITNAKDVLDNLYKEANFTILLSNLTDKETQTYPNWAKPYEIVETQEGTKIAYLGLTAPMPLTYEPFGWHVLFPKDVLPTLIPLIASEADVIVLLSHLGLPDDKLIAEAYPEIDVIIESHTHHLFENGLEWNGVLLAAAGRFGEYVGDVTLCLNEKKMISKQAETYSMALIPDSELDRQENCHYMEEGNNLLMAQKVACLTEQLNKEDTLLLETLSAMKSKANCDVAIVNSGLFLTDLHAGELTKKDLHDCLPHPMNLITVTLLGQDVIRLVYEIEKNRNFLKYFPVIGMKFRGKYFGEIWYDGLTFDEETREVYWNHQPVVESEEYKLVTVDHLAFLPFFPTLEIAGEIQLVDATFLRGVLGDYVSTKYPIKKRW